MTEPPLKQGIGLGGVVALGLGTAVGVSIFSVIAPVTALAGSGMLLSVLIAAVPMFAIAVNYAFMSSVFPTSGGASYEWPRRFLHPAVGFGVAWLRIAGSCTALIVLALVLARYLSIAVPLPTKLLMLLLLAAVLFANVLGVGIAARAQTYLVALLVALFIGFSIRGAFYLDFRNFSGVTPVGIEGILTAVPLLVSLFFGIEAGAELGDEVKSGRKTIPLGIALTIAAAVFLYMLVSAVTIGVLGVSAVSVSDTPILDAAKRIMGHWASPLFVGAATIAIFKSMNAIFLVFSRSLFAMGRSGALPSALARVHPRWNTPYVACLTVFALCTAGLLLPMNLGSLFLALSIPTLLKYLVACFCSAKVVTGHPRLYESASFRPARRAMLIASYGGIFGAAILILLGLHADWRPYVALLVWAAMGASFYLWSSKARTRAQVGVSSQSVPMNGFP